MGIGASLNSRVSNIMTAADAEYVERGAVTPENIMRPADSQHSA